MKRKKLTFIFTIFVIALSAVAFATDQTSVSKAKITVSTGSAGGGWNTDCEENLKPKLAKEGILVTCLTSKGTIENMERVNSGEVDMSYVQTDILYLAWQEDAEYARKLNPGGRTFINESVFCTTSNGAITGFKSFKDFDRPVRIVTPPVGSGSEGTIRFLKENLPGYADVIEILPQEVVEGDKFSISKATSALKSRNPRKRADAVCWVEMANKESEKINAISKNSDLHWIPIDDPSIMDMTFEDETVYPGVAPVYAGKDKSVMTLQVGDTYVYGDNMPADAIEAVAKVIDQNPNYIDTRTMGEKIKGAFAKAMTMSAKVARNVKKTATDTVDAVKDSI